MKTGRMHKVLMTYMRLHGFSAKNRRTFKRLIGYIKPYKLAFIAAVIGMIGYAGVDTLFFSQIETFIDDGLTEQNSDILIYGAIFVPFFFIIRGFFNFALSFKLGGL